MVPLPSSIYTRSSSSQRRVTRRYEFPPQRPGLALAGRAEGERAAAEAGVESVERPHARDRARIVRRIEQASLVACEGRFSRTGPFCIVREMGLSKESRVRHPLMVGTILVQTNWSNQGPLPPMPHPLSDPLKPQPAGWGFLRLIAAPGSVYPAPLGFMIS